MTWHLNDLTKTTQAPTPAPGAELACYAFEDQETQHVIYIGGDNHIHELYWDNKGWHHNDLTIAAHAPLGHNVNAYAFEDQGTQHVVL